MFIYKVMLNARKYIKVFNLGFQEQLEYRVDFFFKTLIMAIAFLIQYFLWKSIYQSSNEKLIANFTLQEMLTYLLLAKLWSWSIDSGEIDRNFTADVRDGGLSCFLIRPINEQLYRFSTFFSHKICNILICLLTVIIVIFLFPVVFKLSPSNSWIYIPLIGFLSLVLQFMFSYTIALLSFWWLDIEGFLFIKRLIMSFLTGTLVPLTIIPDSITKIVLLLPFQYMVFFPIQVTLGKLDTTSITNGIIVQVIWIIVFTLLSKILWTLGLRQYTSAGA